jgi:ketosteroid isomerase-like protein
MAETIGRGDMKPSHLGRSIGRSIGRTIGRRGISIQFLLALMAIIGAGTTGKLPLRAGDLDASPPVAEVRIVPGPTSAAIEQELRSADRALIQAIAASDPGASARLLDPEFTWIDRDGRGRSKSDLADRMILLAAGADSNVAVQSYGRVALITGTHRLTPDNVPAFFARVWVRQPSGWRLLLYHETAPPDPVIKDARFAIPAESPARCENPCRSLPYKPLSPNAQEIVASFMAGERAVFDADAQAANRILGDDVLFVTPADAQPVNKDQSMAALRAARQAGETNLPPAVDAMALWVFGNAGVMSADEESPAGELLRTTRIWAKRDGCWQLTFSQQTLVQ